MQDVDQLGHVQVKQGIEIDAAEEELPEGTLLFEIDRALLFLGRLRGVGGQGLNGLDLRAGRRAGRAARGLAHHGCGAVEKLDGDEDFIGPRISES